MTSEPSPVAREVDPGDVEHVRAEVSETYLGDPVEIPVTVVEGAHHGPRLGVTAAIHGDELNGVKVAQEVAARYDPDELHGTLVVIHVCNVPGYLAQQRYIPIYDLDLNRSFPGKAESNTAERIANAIYNMFITKCDYVVDLHTSTRNRTTMYHVRANMNVPEVSRLAHAFGANVYISGAGDEGSLRRTACADGIPTITVEMGRAHRFQTDLIDRALEGIESVLAEFEMHPDRPVLWPGWRRIIDEASEKTWLRADTGGLVEMEYETPFVNEGEPICTITDHFKTRETVVTAPFTGLIVGTLENPVAAPGHPLCHLVGVSEEIRMEIEREIERGEFPHEPLAE